MRKKPKDVTLSVPVRIDARYVEAGTDRRGGGSYVLRYKWEGGGLFGGRSLHSARPEPGLRLAAGQRAAYAAMATVNWHDPRLGIASWPTPRHRARIAPPAP